MEKSKEILKDKRILVIDDDSDLCLLLERYLTQQGCDVSTAFTAKTGLQTLAKFEFDLALCDFRLPDMDGLEIIRQIKSRSPETQVIVITGYSDVRLAIQSIKTGAFEYVTKPIQPEEILSTMVDAFRQKEDRQTESEDRPESRQKTDASSKTEKPFVKGSSSKEREIQHQIELLAPTDMSVLILGETGSGKEVVARSVHAQSNRSERAFVAVDCGALPKDLASSELFGHVKGAFTGALNEKAGSFEIANGGTLFLDEVGNLSYDNQVKLLRAIQEGQIKKLGGNQPMKVDVRIIAATNEDLKDAVLNGAFREDLFFRLNEFELRLPPLRDRQEDLGVYIDFFIHQANTQLGANVDGVSEQVMEYFRAYSWPGNLRELKNIIKRAVLLTRNGTIGAGVIPPEVKLPVSGMSVQLDSHATDLKSAAEQAERQVIEKVLRETNFNKSRAAEILKIDRKTLYNKISAYGIDA